MGVNCPKLIGVASLAVDRHHDSRLTRRICQIAVIGLNLIARLTTLFSIALPCRSRSNQIASSTEWTTVSYSTIISVSVVVLSVSVIPNLISIGHHLLLTPSEIFRLLTSILGVLELVNLFFIYHSFDRLEFNLLFYLEFVELVF